MITFTKKILMNKEAKPPEYYVEGSCLHGDEKPTSGIFNGSFLTEIDTGKLFFFDAENTTWREWGA